MRFLKYSFITLLSLVLIGSAGYLLAASGIQSKPGYANLSLPGWLSTDTSLSLNLGPRGLKPARWIIKRALNASHNSLELSERILMGVLQELQGIQLRIYEVNDNRQVFEQAIDESVVSLRQEDWQVLLKMREDDKRIVVLQAGSEDLISGVSVLVSTPENAVFVNLIGPLDPETIAKVADSYN